MTQDSLMEEFYSTYLMLKESGCYLKGHGKNHVRLMTKDHSPIKNLPYDVLTMLKLRNLVVLDGLIWRSNNNKYELQQ